MALHSFDACAVRCAALLWLLYAAGARRHSTAPTEHQELAAQNEEDIDYKNSLRPVPLRERRECAVPVGFPSRQDLCCPNGNIFKVCQYAGRLAWSCQCKNGCEDMEKMYFVSKYAMQASGSVPTLAHIMLQLEQDIYMNARADLDPVVPGGPYVDKLWPGKFRADLKFVLFLLPQDDPNRAFGMMTTLCARLRCWHTRGFQAVMRTVSSLAQASAVLDMFPDRALHNVVLAGHGEKKRLVWGSGGADGYLAAGQKKSDEFLAKLGQKLVLHGPGVTLDSCSTAGKPWIGRSLFKYVASKLSGARVVASKTPLSDDMWQTDDDKDCLAGDNVVFDRYGKDVTAISRGQAHKCKDLSKADILLLAEDSGLCITQCRSNCQKVLESEWKKALDHSAWAELAEQVEVAKSEGETLAAADAHCNVGRREVCQLDLRAAASDDRVSRL